MDLDEDSPLLATIDNLTEEAECENPFRYSDEHVKSFLGEMFIEYGEMRIIPIRDGGLFGIVPSKKNSFVIECPYRIPRV